MKICVCCKAEKVSTEFYPDKYKKDGLSAYCRACSKARAAQWAKNNSDKRREQRNKWAKENPELHKLSKQSWKVRNKAKVMADTRKRQAAQLRSVPLWFNAEPVVKLYEKARQYGFHVDHIVPLQSDLVCGLHVFDNLQLMHPSENCSKQNKFWPGMP